MSQWCKCKQPLQNLKSQLWAYLAPLAQSEKDNSVNCSDMIDSSNPITFSEKKMFVKMCIKLQFEEYFLISRQQTN